MGFFKLDRFFVFGCLWLLFFGSPFLLADEELRLHSLFTDHAVLQQELPVPIWGSAKPGARVSVVFDGQEKSGEASANGDWMVVLDPLSSDLKPRTLTVSSGQDSIVINNILVGEVWIGSGQSNMAMPVGRSSDANQIWKEAKAGRFQMVRLFKVPVAGADQREREVQASWQMATEESVKNFSATAFYFARKLSEDRGIPVGIIQSANGGTNAYSWINSVSYEQEEIGEHIRDHWAGTVKKHPAAMKSFQESKAAWEKEKNEAKAAGKSFQKRAPREPLGPGHVKRPSGHYNAMIAPLQPFAIRGVIWYQGEANSRLPFYPRYRDLMLALVEDWRSDWSSSSFDQIPRRDFPFYLVQLPNFQKGDSEGWPRIREQMLQFWKEGTNTGMVVTIDVGDSEDIHPTNKKPVGDRLANFARAQTYGADIVYSGPIFEALRIDEDRAILDFQHQGGGLRSLDDKALRNFEVAHEKGKFFKAEATIDGDQLIVRSPEVPEPRAVRYAWSGDPEAPNFGNEEGYPASPFRTDNW